MDRQQLTRRLHETGVHWWDRQLEEYTPLPEFKDLNKLWDEIIERSCHVKAADYPFWLLTGRSMQYAWGGNVGIQMMKEMADNVFGHDGIVMNAGKAAELGIAEGDLIEVTSPVNATRGYARLRQGVRPDVVVMIAQFGQWKMPFAKDLKRAGLNALVPMNVDSLDGGGALMLMIAIAYFQTTPSVIVGLTALAFVGLGLLCVWLEIGRPWRFLHVFLHPQTSWMTREAAVAVALFITALIGLLLQIPLAISIAGVLGFVFLYCQGRILSASKGVPVWREPAIIALIVITGLAEGAAILFILFIFSNAEKIWLLYALGALLICRLLSWRRYRQRLADNHTPPGALAILDGMSKPYIILGHLVPLVFLGAVILAPSFTKPLMLLACLLIIANGWLLKFTIIARAANVQGYALSKLQTGRPKIKPPVRRGKDRFVFDRKYDQSTEEG